MRIRLWLIGSVLSVAALSGCGTPGAPQLPSLQLALPVEDLTATRVGNQVELDWTLPTKNTDRTLVKHIPETRICRREGVTLMSSCVVVGEVATPKSQQQPKQKGQQPRPEAVRMHYVDHLPQQLGMNNPAGFVTYAVEEMNSKGRSAGLSNQVAVPVAPTLPAPEELTTQVSGEGVTISWMGGAIAAVPQGVTYQYQIARRPVGGGYVVVGEVAPSPHGSYLDKTFEWEKKYEYRITTLTHVQSHGMSASVEGESSKPVEVFTRDIYPPAQPVGLQAVFSSVGQKPFIDLTWAPNLESDLAGYNVFRRSEDGTWVKLNQKLVEVPSFRDDKVKASGNYLYSVSAVDLRGNESPRSSAASETVPDKW